MSLKRTRRGGTCLSVFFLVCFVLFLLFVLFFFFLLSFLFKFALYEKKVKENFF